MVLRGMKDGDKQNSGLVKKSVYAKMCGFNRSYLSQADVIEKLGPALVPQENGKILIDVALADKILKRDTDPTKVRKEPADTEPEQDSLSFLRREREGVKLEHERIDLEERKGKLVYRDEVYQACSLAGQMIREHLKTRNRTIAEKAATMTDPQAIKILMDEDDRILLETIGDELRRKFAETEGGHPTTH